MSSETTNIQKMIFIYNSVMSGWTVKKIDNDNFEFTKKKEKVKTPKESLVQKDFSAVPKNTLKLIEEAENN